MVKFIADIFEQRRAWNQPKQKREPFTYKMFEALAIHIEMHYKRDGSFFLSVTFAVFDWCRLSLHTGSRVAEYGQSKKTPGKPFAAIPLCDDAGEWAGYPIAFIREDFVFFDSEQVRHHYQACLRNLELAEYIYIRFRYDKSPENFTIRKYKRQRGSLLCPVTAGLSILRRADVLGIPAAYPIGAFRSPRAAPGEYTFITGDHVKKIMQEACILAYPDPNHYLRLHIHLLMSHSNRITAAVVLHNAGEDPPTIAFRLRWSEETVRFYLRDCFRAIGRLTQQALLGAALN